GPTSRATGTRTATTMLSFFMDSFSLCEKTEDRRQPNHNSTYVRGVCVRDVISNEAAVLTKQGPRAGVGSDADRTRRHEQKGSQVKPWRYGRVNMRTLTTTTECPLVRRSTGQNYSRLVAGAERCGTVSKKRISLFPFAADHSR